MPDGEQLNLGPLSLAAVHELLKYRLGRSLPRPVLLRVHEAAHGNPLYSLEIAREVIVCTVTPPAVTTIPTVAASRLPLPPGDKAPLTPQVGGRDVRRSEPRYDSWLGKGQW